MAKSVRLGPAYLPAYADGVANRAGRAWAASAGPRPCQFGVINRVMDQHLKGHPYVKSALDIACWDILGLACGRAGLDPAGRLPGRGGQMLSRDLAGHARAHGRACRRMSCRGASPFPDQGRRRRRSRHRPHPRRCREPQAWRGPRGRRQHELAALPGGARGARPSRTSTSTSNSPAWATASASRSGGAPAGRSSSTSSSTGRPCCCAPMPTTRWTWPTSSSARSAASLRRARCVTSASPWTSP